MSNRPPNIVLVDDDIALRTALTFTLELDGFVVTALGSGEDLLNCTLPDAPACLVLDQNMGGLTGLDSLAQLRSRAIDLPALLITSHPRQSVRDAAAALGAVIVEKPLLGDALLSEIDAALKRQAAIRKPVPETPLPS
ncbi:response regulator transcription factor [Phenylobacterium sp.]|uniref:response regulator transcription factor n=1 Tax=Phenylobacterium sp. TaxID=1871053 RepID=UPI00271EDA94|nr:response regulator [Phenylobacterium sp.]MDO8379862.1 response regulator [Phenylobacterium sp.]